MFWVLLNVPANSTTVYVDVSKGLYLVAAEFSVSFGLTSHISYLFLHGQGRHRYGERGYILAVQIPVDVDVSVGFDPISYGEVAREGDASPGLDGAVNLHGPLELDRGLGLDALLPLDSTSRSWYGRAGGGRGA